MKRSIAMRAALAWTALMLPAAAARAHFIWIDATFNQQPPTVQIMFNETAEPGDAKLIGKIGQTKAWARRADGQTTPLELAPPNGEMAPAALTATLPEATTGIEAACDYGVYTRAPGGVRFHYFAKCLVAGSQVAPSDRMRLDLAAQPRGEKLELTVRFDGRPDGSAELLAIDEQGNERQIKLDENGQAAIDLPAKPRLALRAKHAAPQEAGDLGGQKYAQTWYFATLIMPGGTAEQSAADLLAEARDGRAVWSDFPGLSADVTLSGDEAALSAQVTIDASGVVSLSGERSPLHDWAQEQLESLVQHRMPDGQVTTGRVEFVDEPAAHPLGRLIDLGDDTLRSRYRVKEGVIREVNRVSGPTRFTISVLAIQRNQQGKYLPRAFTMTFWDVASGELKQSLAYWNDWQRVGNFDLPQRILEVACGPAGSKTKQLTLSNFRLTGSSAPPAGP